MGAARSATVALAALLAGSVAPATLAWAQAGTGIVVREAAVEPRADLPSEVPGAKPEAPATEAAKPDAPSSTSTISDVAKPDGSAPVSAPAASVPSSDPAKPAAADPAAPAPTEGTAAAPVVPADPLGAAIAARLSSSVPLLPRFNTKEREAVQAFYALGAFKPVWIVDGRFTPAATSAIERLSKAAEDGLDPAAYPVPTLAAPGATLTDAETAQAEVKLSAAIALYARDARGGRIVPSNLSKLITPVLDLPAPDVVLGQVAAAGAQAGDVLQRYNPQTAGYRGLKARLAALRGPVAAPSSTGTLSLPPGPMLKVGMRDARVPLLRAHFGLETRTAGTLDAAPGEPDTYDASVAAAVAGFQRSRGLHASGTLNAQTVLALAGASPKATGGPENESALLVNMERWRWLPGDLGSDYVLVNVPEFRLRVVRDGVQRDEARVIVGKPESPTPLFSGAMEYAVVNPSWYVPPSILKTMLAEGRTAGFEVLRRGNTISLRQPPGERNALGFIKFMFPNQHAVYLHDTPNRTLFSRSERALSHGCVRVDDPFRFADSVMPAAWTEERLKKLIGKGERTIQLGRKLPVHLAYFTAVADEFGGYRTFPDLYGYDARMRTAMGLSGGSPAMVRGRSEPARVVTGAPDAGLRRAAVRKAPAPPRVAQRPVRAPSEEFGEPGLMTPRTASTPRTYGWW